MAHIESLFDMVVNKSYKGQYSFEQLEALFEVDLAKVIHPNTGQTLLHTAAGFGRISLVKYLLSHDADVNALDNMGQAPLHNAACHGHFITSDKLLSMGANVDTRDKQGLTPLFLVFARRENSQSVSDEYWPVIRLLLAKGANPIQTKADGKPYLSFLRNQAHRTEICLIYLFNLSDEERKPKVDQLISVRDFFGLIKDKLDIDLMLMICTDRLINSRLKELNDITPLHRAAGYNCLELAKVLLEKGADANAADQYGRIPLHNAATFGHLEMIELLASSGSDINKQDASGSCPLHEAASHKSATACLKLIQLGADLNLRDSLGKLPYDLAKSDDVRAALKPSFVQMAPSTASEQAIYIVTPTSSNRIEYKTRPDELMLDSASRRSLFETDRVGIHAKLISIEKSDPRFNMIQERMCRSVVPHPESGIIYSTYDIMSIKMVLNKKVWQKYQSLTCVELETDNVPKNEKLLFHGSTHADEIISRGFNEGFAKRDGMFGAGIYFADHSSKSNQYSFGLGQGCQKHKDKSCYVCQRTIFYTQVALGRPLMAVEPMSLVHAPIGFSSVIGTPELIEDLRYPEYVIYNGSRAYPLYVIQYRIKK